MELAEITAVVDAKLKKGIIDGTNIGKEMRARMKMEIEEKGLKPYLVTLLVGEDEASKVYVNFKEKACNAIGIKNNVFRMSKDTTEEELFSKIDELNSNHEVDGILLQLPLPAHLKEQDAIRKFLSISLKMKITYEILSGSTIDDIDVERLVKSNSIMIN